MNIHIFDLDWTLCEEEWILTDNMINNLIKLTKKDKVYINTWRWLKSLKKAIKNNRHLLNNINFVTENGSKYNKKIYNFNKAEIQEITSFFEKNLNKMEYFDFWIGDKLYTFSSKKIDDENENRVYEDTFLSLKSLIYKNLKVISMFYISFRNKLQYRFQNVSWMFWDNDLILTKKWVNKSKILKMLDCYNRIFVYWNWENDLPLFQYKKIRKFNIWIWNDKKILQLSDIKLKSHIDLEEYLK